MNTQPGRRRENRASRRRTAVVRTIYFLFDVALVGLAIAQTVVTPPKLSPTRMSKTTGEHSVPVQRAGARACPLRLALTDMRKLPGGAAVTPRRTGLSGLSSARVSSKPEMRSARISFIS